MAQPGERSGLAAAARLPASGGRAGGTGEEDPRAGAPEGRDERPDAAAPGAGLRVGLLVAPGYRSLGFARVGRAADRQRAGLPLPERRRLAAATRRAAAADARARTG